MKVSLINQLTNVGRFSSVILKKLKYFKFTFAYQASYLCILGYETENSTLCQKKNRSNRYKNGNYEKKYLIKFILFVGGGTKTFLQN